MPLIFSDEDHASTDYNLARLRYLPVSETVDDMTDYADIFYLSCWRATQRTLDGVAFLDAFYKNFLASSPEVAHKFKNTSFDRLTRMLSISIVQVAKYYQTHRPDPLLKVFAAKHGRRDLDIKPELYEHWVDALIRTVETYDPEFDDTTRESWRRVLEPGVEYMRSRYAEPPEDLAGNTTNVTWVHRAVRSLHTTHPRASTAAISTKEERYGHEGCCDRSWNDGGSDGGELDQGWLRSFGP